MQSVSAIPRSCARCAGIFAIIVVTLIAVKLADVVVGTFKPAKYSDFSMRSIRLREHPPNMTLTIRAGPDILSVTENLPSKPILFRTDDDGFILGPTTQSGRVDITFIGGSTTECQYVEER